ncbi:MAG TPA: LLM class flavin-dependent oxidoreductase, partial [Acidimicrobiales bacterium]|nr:LLM class flavin-dependent oxidoreductase [Acidimicrobiales bacterium]
MEFGIFIQGFVPRYRRQADPDAEHTALMHDIECVIAADKARFKYVWATEHHFLDEYSHMSANDVALAYLARATERIHLGSGIFNPLPQVNHPAKVAEKVAMLDHLSGGRFEFGTGRGAGSHEILAFLPGMTDLSKTREIWEDVIAEFPKMWLQDEYEGYEGKYWRLPPRKVLPKPWKKPHPAMWYAAGNVSSYEMAARRGLGVLGFSVGSIQELEPVMKAYKKAIKEPEPVGAFVNDNIMVTTGAFVAEDDHKAI